MRRAVVRGAPGAPDGTRAQAPSGTPTAFRRCPLAPAGSARQGRRTGECPQPPDEIELDPPSVEIAREVEQMGLDLTGLLAEGRIRARCCTRRERPARGRHARKGRVDAVSRDQGIDPDEVGRGNPGRRPGRRREPTMPRIRGAGPDGSASSTRPRDELADQATRRRGELDPTSPRPPRTRSRLGTPIAQDRGRRPAGRGRRRNSGPPPGPAHRAAGGSLDRRTPSRQLQEPRPGPEHARPRSAGLVSSSISRSGQTKGHRRLIGPQQASPDEDRR